MADEFLYSVRGPKSWMMMTSYELTDALKETDVALVPCGANPKRSFVRFAVSPTGK
jgi:hypothetical protein